MDGLLVYDKWTFQTLWGFIEKAVLSVWVIHTHPVQLLMDSHLFYDWSWQQTANDARLRINKAPDTDQFHKDFTAAFNLPGCQQTAKHCDGDT